MKKPPFLRPGDSIGILSTARSTSSQELESSLKIIDEWGLKPVIGKTIDEKKDQFAGSDTFRAADFQDMIDNPEIKAIWCARGGYGTVRIIDRIDFSGFLKNPKWIIGFSDITVLHSHLHKMKIQSLHAQMPHSIDTKSKESADSIFNVLFGKKFPDISIRQKPDPGRPGTASGLLTGGNLSILYSLCGSPSAIDTKGKILFLEDLDEYLYHIDRMMMNLKRNGMLENLAGLIVGGMSDMNDNAIPFGKNAKEIIRDAVEEYKYPVGFNFPAGHIPDNRALILGHKVHLNIDANSLSLRY